MRAESSEPLYNVLEKRLNESHAKFPTIQQTQEQHEVYSRLGDRENLHELTVKEYNDSQQK